MSGATSDPVLKRDVTDVKSNGSENDSPSSLQDEQVFQFRESRKLGVTGCVFLIINKMIGTGIFSTPSGVFAATGSVGVCLFLWIIGEGPFPPKLPDIWLIIQAASLQSAVSASSSSLVLPFPVRVAKRITWNESIDDQNSLRHVSF